MMLLALWSLSSNCASLISSITGAGPGLGEAGEAAIVFGGKLESRERRRLAGEVGIALARHQLAVAVALAHPGERAFAFQEGVKLLRELEALEAAIERVGIVAWQIVGVLLGDFLVAQALEGGFLGLVAGARQRHEHDLAGELAAVGREMLDLVDWRDDDRRPDHAVGAAASTRQESRSCRLRAARPCARCCW